MEDLKLITTLKGHNDKVWQAKWNSNGNLICSCGADKKFVYILRVMMVNGIVKY